MRTLVTLGLGALAMYLFDPQHGRRRRALLREQMDHAKQVVRKRASGAAQDLSLPADTPQRAQHLGR